MPDDQNPTPTESTTTETPWQSRIFDPATPGRFVEKYQEMLPPDMEDTKNTLAEYSDLEAIFRALKANKTMAREKAGVKPLTSESTAEQIAEYRRIMGIPETPYEFPKPESLPAGIEWQEDRMKDFGKWAHDNNLSPAQSKGAMELYMKYLTDDSTRQQETYQKQRDEFLAAEKEEIRTKFGGTIGKVVQMAQRTALLFGIPAERVDPDHPQFVGTVMLRVLNEHGKALGEGQLPGAGAVVNMTPERQLFTITQDKSSEEYKLWSKGDKEMVRRATELRKKMVASKKTA